MLTSFSRDPLIRLIRYVTLRYVTYGSPHQIMGQGGEILKRYIITTPANPS